MCDDGVARSEACITIHEARHRPRSGSRWCKEAHEETRSDDVIPRRENEVERPPDSYLEDEKKEVLRSWSRCAGWHIQHSEEEHRRDDPRRQPTIGRGDTPR